MAAIRQGVAANPGLLRGARRPHRRGHRRRRGQPLLRATASCTRSPAPSTAGPAPTSAIITATQIGYAAGLLLVVPLGDLHPRRGLVTRLFCLGAVALVGCALAPSLWVFAVASVLVGGASVAGQVMIPFAADLAPEERRGRVVARIMTGLLLGILLARTVSGLVAQAAGWRAIYWLSAGAHGRLRRGALAGAARRGAAPAPQLRRARRVVAPPPGHRARAAAPGLARRLRLRRVQRAVDHAGLPALGSPYRYSNAGHRALRAGRRGRDRGGQPRRQAGRRRPASPLTTVGAGVLLAGSFALLWAGRTSLAALIVGIVVLDMGTQGMQITNQAVIYALRPDAAEPDQQRLHGLLLRRRRRRLAGRRRPLRHARLGRRLPPRCRPRAPDPGHVGLRPDASAARSAHGDAAPPAHEGA